MNRKFLGAAAIFFGVSLLLPAFGTLVMGEKFVKTICRRECLTYDGMKAIIGEPGTNLLIAAIWLFLAIGIIVCGAKLWKKRDPEQEAG